MDPIPKKNIMPPMLFINDVFETAELLQFDAAWARAMNGMITWVVVTGTAKLSLHLRA